MGRKIKRTLLIMGVVGILVLIVRVSFIVYHYNNAKKIGIHHWTMTEHPFYSGEKSFEFITDGTIPVELYLWWNSFGGSIVVSIHDTIGNQCYISTGGTTDEDTKLYLEKGKYHMNVVCNNFTGAVAIGYNNITPVVQFPNDRYQIISKDSKMGFHWDYLLYLPEVRKSNYLLVVPNNTGTVSDLIDIHMEKAKDLIIWKSELANELGIPLLVPVFPRPNEYEEMYTHALDRATLLSSIEGYKGLDQQLIAMIDDARMRLFSKGFKTEKKVLLSGFSASGDFTDRFTFLHTDMVRAVSSGGCDHMVPFAELNGENLPYPIGIYDYKEITGKEFDLEAFKSIDRFLYKGSLDEGGWVTITKEDGVQQYTGKEYFEKFEEADLLDELQTLDLPIYQKGDLTEKEENEISYRAFQGKLYIDRFNVIKEIYEELQMDHTQFHVYEGIGHEINDQIIHDEVKFFQEVLY
ncbi:MAG: hypothetical protein K0S47_3057 [Herbinix sp.]|jgi:hypothetical protein|nr:hypothetical protein [Herbinix sp.]